MSSPLGIGFGLDGTWLGLVLKLSLFQLKRCMGTLNGWTLEWLAAC